ncbi:MAG: hypothetical protein D3926_12765 [Desulfobacteraceae bacterium]|nr:MAG: hypothetical protein D3926_12765 [Desulfobacteraceae bacterium]
MKNELIDNICRAVEAMDRDHILALVKRAVKLNDNPHTIVHQGLCNGLEILGQKCETGEVFFPHLVEMTRTIETAMNLLKPFLPHFGRLTSGTVILGVVEGDIHDLGKNIIKMILTSSGFRVMDLGKNVPPSQFVEHAIREKANIICMSAYLDTVIDGMGHVIERLRSTAPENRIKVVVGGRPVSEAFANEIGAHGYAPNAAMALEVVRSLEANHQGAV